MRLRLPILASLNLLLLFFAAQKMCAQIMSADDYFNGGAQLYISNNIPAALEKTESGLKVYPNDEKLKKLEQLLKQQQQSQSQQNQQQQQNQQSRSQQQQSQKNQSQQNQNSRAQNQQQQKQNQAKQNEQKNSQQQAQKKSGEEKNEQANTMTPEQAKQLLDSQKDSEQFLSMKPKEQPQNEHQPVKDW